LYFSTNIIRQIKSRRMRWAGHVARMGEERNVYRVLMGKPEGKGLLGRPRRKWEDGIRMYLRDIGWRSADWIQLAHDRDRWPALVNTLMNLRFLAPRGSYVILYFSTNIIRQIKSRRMRWVGHVARMGEERNVYRVLMGNPEGKGLLVRPRRR
jgi:hypothetical protein